MQIVNVVDTYCISHAWIQYWHVLLCIWCRPRLCNITIVRSYYLWEILYIISIPAGSETHLSRYQCRSNIAPIATWNKFVLWLPVFLWERPPKLPWTPSTLLPANHCTNDLSIFPFYWTSSLNFSAIGTSTSEECPISISLHQKN